MLVFFALGNAKVLSFALADAKVPNASSFAFWWNIGLKCGAFVRCYYGSPKSLFIVFMLIKWYHLITGSRN